MKKAHGKSGLMIEASVEMVTHCDAPLDDGLNEDGTFEQSLGTKFLEGVLEQMTVAHMEVIEPLLYKQLIEEGCKPTENLWFDSEYTIWADSQLVYKEEE